MGPQGQISDYPSKNWAGLVPTNYAPRWEMFTQYSNSTPSAEYNDAEFGAQLLDLGVKRCEQTWNAPAPTREQTNLKKVLAYVKNQWPAVFGA